MTSSKEKSYSVHSTELSKNLKCRTILFHPNYAMNTSGFDVLRWQIIYFFFDISFMINADINVLMNLLTCLQVPQKMTLHMLTFMFFLLQFAGDLSPQSAKD